MYVLGLPWVKGSEGRQGPFFTSHLNLLIKKLPIQNGKGTPKELVLPSVCACVCVCVCACVYMCVHVHV